MTTLMSCSFGLMVAFAIGTVFSFSPVLSAFVLGAFACAVHLALFYLQMTRPPGNFFFIMTASVAICMPFNLELIPHRIGLVGIGTMISCLLGLFYSLLIYKKNTATDQTFTVANDKYINLIESITFGLFVGLGLLIGRLLKLENPYWIPTSCVAVMQGASTRHVWQRSIQRMVGTLIGLILTWSLLLLQPAPLVICISIIILQVLVEMIVARNYALAVILITVLTIFLAESGNSMRLNPTALFQARLIDIVIGSVLGAIGGWVLYNQQLKFYATQKIRKTQAIISKLK